MKNKLKLILSLLLCFFIGILIFNYIYNNNLANSIEKKINKIEFSENSYLNGLEIKFNKISCEGFINKKCEITDLNFNLKKENKTIFKTEKVFLYPKLSDGLNVNIEIINLRLNEEIKTMLFENYEEKEYKELGKKIYNHLFPINLNIKINVEKGFVIEEKEKIDSGKGNISFGIENNIIKTNLETEIFIKNKMYDEEIEIKLSENIKDKELKGGLKNSGIPYYSKINNFKFNIENKNIEEFLYDLYDLGMINANTAENKKMINLYFFGTETTEKYIKEEFKNEITESIREYYKNIPNDEKEFKNLIAELSKVLNKNIKELEIKGTNIGDISTEKFYMLLSLDNLNTTKRYLDDAFKIEYIEKKKN